MTLCFSSAKPALARLFSFVTQKCKMIFSLGGVDNPCETPYNRIRFQKLKLSFAYNISRLSMKDVTYHERIAVFATSDTYHK